MSASLLRAWTYGRRIGSLRRPFCPPERNLFVSRSLSVLLPVKNAQATLNSAVHEILDVMTDSGDRFEVLIIDDGSTDATSEVAHELTRHYPQIRLVRHGMLARPRCRHSHRPGTEPGRSGNAPRRRSGFSILERPSPAAGRVASRPARPNYLSRREGLRTWASDGCSVHGRTTGRLSSAAPLRARTTRAPVS